MRAIATTRREACSLASGRDGPYCLPSPTCAVERRADTMHELGGTSGRGLSSCTSLSEAASPSASKHEMSHGPSSSPADVDEHCRQRRGSVCAFPVANDMVASISPGWQCGMCPTCSRCGCCARAGRRLNGTCSGTRRGYHRCRQHT